MLESPVIRLRALEPLDAAALLEWENLAQYWRSGNTLAPYSRRNVMRYIEEYTADPFSSGELRLVIEARGQGAPRPVGFIELYNVQVRHRRACVGLLVAPRFQRRGYAGGALALMEGYCREHLGLHQLLAAVEEGNAPSRGLFLGAGYTPLATLPDYLGGGPGAFRDALLLHKLL